MPQIKKLAKPVLGPQAPGLVSLVTSDTEPDLITLNRDASRLKNMRKSVITSARLFSEQTTSSGFRFKPAMLTLTYAPGVDWKKNHISALLKSIREYLRRKGFAFLYVWVLELTKQGIPHYHVVLWLPKGVTLPKPDKRGWWPHGITRIEWARNAVGYLAKYASKGTDMLALPKVARMHGNGGLSQDRRSELSWWKLPQWVREHFAIADRAIRCPGGGWISRLSGEHLESLYVFVGHSDNWQNLHFRPKNILVH